MLEQLQLADSASTLLEQEANYYKEETERMHSRLLLLGEEIALTPATLLFKSSAGGAGAGGRRARRADARGGAEDPVVSSLTFDFIDGGGPGGGAAAGAGASKDISLPSLSDIVHRRGGTVVESPGCDVLLGVMEKLWSGHQYVDWL